MTWMKRNLRLGALAAVSAGCLLAATAAFPQSTKSAKQAESLEKAGASAKASVQDSLAALGKLLAGYNAIMDGEAKDTQKAYKSLVDDLKGTGKKIDGAKKALSDLNKEADKFFKAWEQDLAGISSESVREKSANRMAAAKQRYAALGETLSKAAGELAPVVQELNDQIVYLGRDLSPAAIADLKDEQAALNQQADETRARIKEMLQTAGKTEAEASAEIEGEDD